MKLNVINGRIGDTVLAEPAIRAWAIEHQERVSLYVLPQMRGLFLHHPWIDLVDEPFSESIHLCPTTAFGWATQNRRPFGAGYFHQLGLGLGNHDLHYEMFGPEFASPPDRENRSYIAPFSRCCNSHRGMRPNIEPPLGWWAPIVEASPFPIYSLGDHTDPDVPGTIPYRDNPLRDVVVALRRCRLLITVETAIVHLANAAKCPTVYLSSATPEWFCRPRNDVPCKVVRAGRPEQFAESQVIAAYVEYAENRF